MPWDRDKNERCVFVDTMGLVKWLLNALLENWNANWGVIYGRKDYEINMPNSNGTLASSLWAVYIIYANLFHYSNNLSV